jgi:hypothetical protein
MVQWLQLSDDQRRTIIEQASINSNIPVKAIEKDWWVTLVLKAIFQTPYAEHLLFKGGTSLSKGWKLIERFSEDIDIAIDREFLGYGGTLNKSQIKNLKRAACYFTSTTLKDSIQQALVDLGVPAGMLAISAVEIPVNRPDTDPQALIVDYPSLYDPIPYINDSVKIEVSARSLKEPWSLRNIQSLLSGYFDNPAYLETPFSVPIVEPVRTFLEKAFLLHEEFSKEAENIRYIRMSRHLYDLERLMDTEHGHQALQDIKFYNSIVEHRKHFHNVDITNHKPVTISFLPPEEITEAYKKDFEQMVEQMIYGNALSFSDVIIRLQTLTERFRQAV